MIYQKQLPSSTGPRPHRTPERVGASSSMEAIPAYDTDPEKQSEAFKELVNKLAWALGSTYRVPYGNTWTGARQNAVELAKSVITDHGYPRSIQKA